MVFVYQLILVVKLGIVKVYAQLAIKDMQSHLDNVLLLTCHAKQQIPMDNVLHAIQAMYFIKRIALLFLS